MGQLSITLTPDQKVAAALGVALVLAIAGTAAPKIAVNTSAITELFTLNGTTYDEKITTARSFGLFRQETRTNGNAKKNGTQVKLDIDSVIREQNDCDQWEASLDSNSTKKKTGLRLRVWLEVQGLQGVRGAGHPFKLRRHCLVLLQQNALWHVGVCFIFLRVPGGLRSLELCVQSRRRP